MNTLTAGDLRLSTSSTIIADHSSTAPTKPKKAVVKVNRTPEQFRYGNCAEIAICQAFDIPKNALKVILLLMKVDKKKQGGLSFFEIKRLLNTLCEIYPGCSIYCPNRAKVTYYQLMLILTEGRYLVMFDEHLSYACNGEIWDSYFDNEEIEKRKPTGWWKLGK